MSQDPSPASAAPQAPAAHGMHPHGDDALGAISDFEKSLQGLKKLYEERRELEAKLVDAQSRLVAKETELATRDQELEQARAAHSENERTIQLLRSEAESSEAARLESETAMRTALSEAEERKAKVDAQAAQQTAEEEKARALAKELDTFAAELHRLQEDLEKEKSELETTRASLLDNAKALKAQEADLEARRQASEADLAKRVAELDARAVELSSAAEAAGKADEGNAELTRRLEAETQACEQLRLDVEEIGRRCAAQEEVLSEYEQLLAVERARVHELVSEIHSAGAAPDETKARLNELKVCLSHEREERERLVRTLADLQKAAKGPKQPRENGLRASSQLRQRRLKRCRAILREHATKVRKASEILAKRFEQCEQVLSQRSALAAAKRQLDAASASMARRNASKRAGVLTLCCVVTLALLGALSWSVVGQVWPGDFAARSEMLADGRGRELSDPELDEWRRSLEATLADPQFVETVAGRMRQRGYESLGTAGAVRTMLTSSFSHDSPAPGVFALELRAPGGEKAARTLDVLTTALASDANAARERRADGAVTLIKSPAVAGTRPINDERPQRAGIVMACSVLLTCGLGFGIWSRLSRAKQEFELGSQIDQVLDDAKWSEFTAATTVSRPPSRQ